MVPKRAVSSSGPFLLVCRRITPPQGEKGFPHEMSFFFFFWIVFPFLLFFWGRLLFRVASVFFPQPFPPFHLSFSVRHNVGAVVFSWRFPAFFGVHELSVINEKSFPQRGFSFPLFGFFPLFPQRKRSEPPPPIRRPNPLFHKVPRPSSCGRLFPRPW